MIRSIIGIFLCINSLFKDIYFILISSNCPSILLHIIEFYKENILVIHPLNNLFLEIILNCSLLLYKFP